MLKDLKVLNGNMSLKFDPYNTIYTVHVLENIDSLELEYQLDDDVKISIFGNDSLKFGKNEVVITVYKEEKMESYYLYVFKERLSSVFMEKDIASLNIKKEEIWEYAVPVISSTCFLIILFLFVLLFRKKKKDKRY